jgi:hypothetical protein
MKTHRILGILWFILCCFCIFNSIRIPLTFPILDRFYYYVFAVFGTIYLGGALASIFLFRGAKWARWVVGSLSVLMLMVSAGVIVQGRSFSAWVALLGIFSLASIVMLFLTRHETAT